MWQTTIDDQPGSDVFGSPVVANGVVYIGTSASYAEDKLPLAHDRGSVVALDAATGAMKWKTYTVPVGDDGGAVWSTPSIDAATGLLYVGTGNAYHAPAAGTTDAVLALDRAQLPGDGGRRQPGRLWARRGHRRLAQPLRLRER
jgi:polyvinyl alcohol dehydrogenase (cytochrome)